MFSRSNLVLTLVLLQITVAGYSQKGTQSPYSIFGIGELNQGQYVSFASMGGIAVANSDSTISNSNNPATYAYFNRYRPVFQIGMNGRHSVFTTTSSSSTQQNFGLNQFQMGLPIKKNWGASFGLVPYSFTGYTITNYDVLDDDTLGQLVNEGSGAVTKVFLGVGYKPLNHSILDTNYSKKDTTYTIKTHILALGVNANYLFGSSAKTQSYEYLTNQQAYNSRVSTALRISDFSTDFGFNYQYYFRPADTDEKMNGSVSVGGTYSPGFKLRAFQDLFAHTYAGSFYGNSAQLAIFDTVEFVTNFKGSVYIPDQYKAGIEYRFGWKPSRKGERLLRIGTEVNYQKWSDYYEDFGTVSYPTYYKDRLTLGFGIEFAPVIGNDPSINILARTNYRFGFNYTQTELTLNATNLTNYGMTFGLGIPVNVNSTNTTINFGASYGNMGTTNAGLINERYLGFYFGLSIIPDRNELWFVKRKYD
jgi:hypothetical protein